jgi:hypothetical protein
MKKIILHLFILTVITACQVVKMPKKPLIAEQVALAYFLDSLVPNDPHLKGRAFEFDFVVRQGIGDWELSVHANAYRCYHIAIYVPEDTLYKYFEQSQIYRAALRMKRIRKIRKVKYENNNNNFLRSFIPVSTIIDTNNIDFSKNKKGELYLGSDYTKLPNGSLYTRSRLQVVYLHEGKLYEKSYYFILRNAVIKGLTCYTTNHTIPYSEGKAQYLITPY